MSITFADLASLRRPRLFMCREIALFMAAGAIASMVLGGGPVLHTKMVFQAKASAWASCCACGNETLSQQLAH